MHSKLTTMILVAAVAGVLAGYVAHELAPDAPAAARSPATSRSSPTSSCA